MAGPVYDQQHGPIDARRLGLRGALSQHLCFDAQMTALQLEERSMVQMNLIIFARPLHR